MQVSCECARCRGKASLGRAKLTSRVLLRADRKQSLQTLLRALLLTYTQLLDALLAPPPSLAHPLPPLPDGRHAPTDPERLTEHMRLIAINMHYLVNELRPVQVRKSRLSVF